MHTLPQKNRISFPIGFVSQLPSVSPVLQQESNVSSFVFPVQCCQILFQLPEKCVWWRSISASALSAAVVFQWHPTWPRPLPSLGAGLWLDCPVSGMSGCPCKRPRPSSQHLATPPWAPLFRICNSLQFCTSGVYSSSLLVSRGSHLLSF